MDAWQQVQDASGRWYWYNSVTGATQWDAPAAGGSTAGGRSGGGGRGGGAGAWQQFTDPNSGAVYYYNSATGETSWTAPAAATSGPAAMAGAHNTWRQAVDSAGQTYYFNVYTQETAWEIPPDGVLLGDNDHDPADAGKWVQRYTESGVPYMYNPDTQESKWVDEASALAPASQSGDWAQYDDGTGNKYWYNSATGETSWTAPAITQSAAPAPARTGVWRPYQDEQGRTVYYHTGTGEMRDTIPEEAAKAWRKEEDSDGKTIYVNDVTGETVGERPTTYSSDHDKGSDAEDGEGAWWMDDAGSDTELVQTGTVDRDRIADSLEAAAVAEAQRIMNLEKREREAAEKAARHAEREARRAKREYQREIARQTAEINARLEREEKARQARAALLAPMLKHPCDDCQCDEATSSCNQCNEALDTYYCNNCWAVNHDTEELAKHPRYWLDPKVRVLEKRKDEIRAARRERFRAQQMRRERRKATRVSAKLWQTMWTADGNMYFYHSITKESQWTMPQVVVAAHDADVQSAESGPDVPLEDGPYDFIVHVDLAVHVLPDATVRLHFNVVDPMAPPQAPAAPPPPPGSPMPVAPPAPPPPPGSPLPTAADAAQSPDGVPVAAEGAASPAAGTHPPGSPAAAMPGETAPVTPEVEQAAKLAALLQDSDDERPVVSSGPRKLTDKERRVAERDRREAEKRARKEAEAAAVKARRASAENKAEVWEEVEDFGGRSFWRNLESGMISREHPVARAKRQIMEAANKGKPLMDRAGLENPRIAPTDAVAPVKEGSNMRLGRRALKDILANRSKTTALGKFSGTGAVDPDAGLGDGSFAPDQDAAIAQQEQFGIFVGDRLIRVIRPKAEMWKPTAHNHLPVLVWGQEYCLVCRRYRYDHIMAYWKQKEDRARNKYATHRSMDIALERKRKENWGKLEQIWISGAEIARRAHMTPEGRAKEEARWAKQCAAERKRLEAFVAQQSIEAAEEKCRNDMWDIEYADRSAAEAMRRKVEDDQVKLQFTLRSEFLQLMFDCKGLERLRRVSWVRGMAIATHSTFHLVRDANSGQRFVLKTMFCPSDTVERRLLSQAQSISNIKCPYLLRIHDYFSHPMYPGAGDRRRGSQVYLFLEHMTGPTMRERLAAGPELTPHQIYRYLKQILTAVTFLHRHNIAHDNIGSSTVFFETASQHADLRLGGYVLVPTPSRAMMLVKRNANLIRKFMRAEATKGGMSGVSFAAMAESSTATALGYIPGESNEPEEDGGAAEAAPAPLSPAPTKPEAAVGPSSPPVRTAQSLLGKPSFMSSFVTRLRNVASPVKQPAVPVSPIVVPAQSNTPALPPLDEATSVEDEQARQRQEVRESAVRAISMARNAADPAKLAALAKLEESKDDDGSALTGATVMYLSPERINLAPASKENDVWAFGCLAYELAAGRLPWLQHKSLNEIINEVPKRHHPLLVPLLRATLQQNPEHRSSAKQVLKYLQSCSGKSTRSSGDTTLLKPVPRPRPPPPPPYASSAAVAIARARARVNPNAPRVMTMEEIKAAGGRFVPVITSVPYLHGGRANDIIPPQPPPPPPYPPPSQATSGSSSSLPLIRSPSGKQLQRV